MNKLSNTSSPLSKSLAAWSTPSDKNVQPLLQRIHHPPVYTNPLHLRTAPSDKNQMFDHPNSFKMFGRFLLQCELAFSQPQIRYDFDADRIVYIGSALKGEALRWTHARARSSPIASMPSSLFIKKRWLAFNHTLLQQEAEQRLFTLQQGSRIVAEFYIHFQVIRK